MRRTHRYILTWLAATILSAFPLVCASETSPPIIYFTPGVDADKRHLYPEALLKLILKNSGTSRKAAELKINAEQDRALFLLRDGVIDVFWTGSSQFRNAEFTPIRYPIFRGLLGYRLVLVNKQNTDILKNVKSISDLREYSIGQGGGWPEIEMYSQNGFTVQSATTYEGLFNMLSKNRFDLFPRSIIEVWDEIATFSQYDLAVDSHILIRYPMSLFFYVRKDDTELEQILNTGFRQIIKSGEFEALFFEYNGGFIDKANLGSRTIIDIENPQFPPISGEESDLYFDL